MTAGPLPVGSYFLTSIPGPIGWAINLGQTLAGRPSRYQHAGVVVSPDGQTVEAFPGGARLGHIDRYRNRNVLLCDGPVQLAVQSYTSRRGSAISGPPEWFEAIQRGHVADAARALVGTPYSALDYLALALLHLHLPSRWVRQRVETSRRLICSALCDRAYADAGVHLYTDGRLPGDVMPADLDVWAQQHGPTTRGPL